VPEYLPNSADSEYPISQANLPVYDPNEFAISASNGDRSAFLVQTRTARTIALNMFDYPTLQLGMDGSGINPKLTDDHGGIVVPVPAGKHMIHISFDRKWDAMLGIGISIPTAVLLWCLVFLTWPQKKLTALRQRKFGPRLSSATMPAAK
jgi:hypothetical protein